MSVMTSTSTQFTATRKLNVVQTLAGHESYFVDGLDGERCELRLGPAITYFPDGQNIMMVSGYGKTARLWDLKTGKEMEEARVVCEHSVREVAVSRDSRWVIVACDEGELKACEVKTGVIRTFKGHSSHMTTIDISRDSKLLVSGSSDGTTRIWDLAIGNPIMASTSTSSYPVCVRFSQDSKKLAVRSGDNFEVWNINIEARKLESKIRNIDHISAITGPMFWTTNDRTIVQVPAFSFDSRHSSAGMINEIDSSTLEIVGVPFRGHTDHIHSLELSFDCTLLVSASYDNTVKLWAFKSHHLLASFNVHDPIIRVALSPDAHQLAYTTRQSGRRRIYLCDIPPDILAKLWPGQEAPSSNVPGNGDPLNSDATAHRSAAAQHNLVPVPVAVQPLGRSPTIHQQDFFVLRYFRKLLSRKDEIPTIAVEPCDPLDCPATSYRLSSKLSSVPTTNLMHCNSVENPGHMLPISKFANRSSSFASRLHHLFNWRPARIDHALPPIIDVPLAEGQTRNAADGAPAADDGCVLEAIDSHPTSRDSIPQRATAGEYGGGRLRCCF